MKGSVVAEFDSYEIMKASENRKESVSDKKEKDKEE